MFYLLEFIRRHAHIFLFILFEICSLYLVVAFNSRQREIFQHTSSRLSASVDKQVSSISHFVSLKNFNERLLNEYASLIQDLIEIRASQIEQPDTALFYANQYDVIPAIVISQSILSNRNYITINKGSDHGVLPSSGVISQDGVVGIVFNVGRHTSQIMSLLHRDIRISASIDGENYFGTLSWPGRAFDRALLKGISKHAEIVVGENVITNGFSSIFPRNLTIGSVLSYTVDQDNIFFDIEVDLSTDFSKLSNVYVIQHSSTEEEIMESDE